MKVSVKARTVAPQMRAAAKVFRETAIVPGTDNKVAHTLLTVAQDYENCAEYIEALEDELAKFQMGAIRNQRAAS